MTSSFQGIWNFHGLNFSLIFQVCYLQNEESFNCSGKICQCPLGHKKTHEQELVESYPKVYYFCSEFFFHLFRKNSVIWLNIILNFRVPLVGDCIFFKVMWEKRALKYCLSIGVCNNLKIINTSTQLCENFRGYWDTVSSWRLQSCVLVVSEFYRVCCTCFLIALFWIRQEIHWRVDWGLLV